MANSRAGATSTAVRRLSLSEFRNYRSLRLDLDGRPVVLSGANGAGKTNLLEAVSFLAPGRGLRRARLAEIGRRGETGSVESDGGQPSWAVAATLESGGIRVDIGTGLVASGNVDNGRRTVRIDGSNAPSQSALGEYVSIAWLTPEMDRLFSDAAAARRRFLDRLIYGIDGGHATRLGDYERAMRERSRVLRDIASPEDAWLSALERTMAQTGVAVAAARRAYVDRLNAACAVGVGPFPAAGLALLGEVGNQLDDKPAVDVEEDYRLRLTRSRRIDAEAGRATFGVHRDDLACRHLGTGSPAERCSTGEQKALLISIILANARLQALERNAAPILLLDEVTAHLDEQRREALFDELSALGSQAWMTGTDDKLFEPLGDRAQRLGVSDATVTPIP
jgi:DNA replication and repair protein RecF